LIASFALFAFLALRGLLLFAIFLISSKVLLIIPLFYHDIGELILTARLFYLESLEVSLMVSVLCHQLELKELLIFSLSEIISAVYSAVL
jgi:hypothetical protein